MLVGATLPNTGSVGFVSFGFTNVLLLPPAPPTPPNDPNTLDVVLDPNVPNCGVFAEVELLVEELTVVKLLLAGGLIEEPNIGVAEALDEPPPPPNEPNIFVEAGVVVVVDDVDKDVVDVTFAVVDMVVVEVTAENNVFAVVVVTAALFAELLPKLKPPKPVVACVFAAGVVAEDEPKVNIGFTAAVIVEEVVVVADVDVVVLMELLTVVAAAVELLLIVDEPKTKPELFGDVADIVVGALNAKLSKDFFSSVTDAVGFTVSILVPNENPPVVEEAVLVPKPNEGAATPVGLSLLLTVVLVVVGGKVNFTLGVLAAVSEDNAVFDLVVAVVVVKDFEPNTKPDGADETTEFSLTFVATVVDAGVTPNLKPVIFVLESVSSFLLSLVVLDIGLIPNWKPPCAGTDAGFVLSSVLLAKPFLKSSSLGALAPVPKPKLNLDAAVAPN